MLNSNKAKWIAVIVCLLIGALAIFMSIKTIKSDMAFMSNAEQTWATVERVWQNTDSDGNAEYTVDVEYVVDGKEYRGTYKTSTYVSTFSEVIIYYDRYNPSVMRTSENRFNGFSTFAIGVGFVITGVVVIFKGGDHTNEQKRKY